MAMVGQAQGEYLELTDWRRTMAELYAQLRSRTPDAETLDWFRGRKDALFGGHPQSPIPPEERSGFKRLDYWPYDPSMRCLAAFTEADDPGTPDSQPPASHGDIPLERIGWLTFAVHGAECRLAAYWVLGYAGGLFVPFRDATSGTETYGGGRYLLDTIKGADLGSDPASGQVVLDFNYAYHPSCAFDARWACPLAPGENLLRFPIRAGERFPGRAEGGR